jgi:hypothetical protein
MKTPVRESKPNTHFMLNMDATFYDIPYDVPKHINSDIPDLVRKSSLHNIDLNTKVIKEDGRWLFRVPYSNEHVFWTNIKYVCHGIDDSLSIGLVAITEDGSEIEILPSAPRTQSTWLDTRWPIPSVDVKQGGLYITVLPLPENPNMSYLRIKILGFADLFAPSTYSLVDSHSQAYLYFTETAIQKPNKDTPTEKDAQTLRLIEEYYGT